MFYSTLTLRFDPVASSFDADAIEAFARDKDLLGVKEHFFEHGGLPHLLLCVSWRMPAAGSARRPKRTEDWRPLLATPEHHDRFDRLRRWRNDAARKTGVPAYAILTNRQAAEAAVLPAPTLAALGTIDQLGPAKVERHGRAILEILGAPAATPAAPEPPDDE